MIVVSLKRSYPNLIDDLGSPSLGVPEYRLEGITRGNWPAMRAELIDGYLDYVVGTWDGVIVSAYLTNVVEQLSDGRIKFQHVEEDRSGDSFIAQFEQRSSSNNTQDPAEWLIGCPMPGGPWRQGEARGTRRYSLDDYLADYPELAVRREEDFGGRMAMHLLAHYAGQRSIDIEDYPALASGGPVASVAPTVLTPASAADVTVVRQPGGTVVVTIPTGTRAQILIEP